MIEPTQNEMINAGFLGMHMIAIIEQAVNAEAVTDTEATLALAAALSCQIGMMNDIEILDSTGFTVKIANLAIKLAYEQADAVAPPSDN